MNPCIKTGANVWIESEGAALHGDLFRVGSTYLLKHTGRYDFAVTKDECEAIWMDTIYPHAALLDHSVLVVPVECRDFKLSESFKQWRKQYD